MNLGIGLAVSAAGHVGKAGLTTITMTDAMNDHIIPGLPRGVPESGRGGAGQQRDEFRSLVENSPDAIARYAPDCRRTYANPAFARLAGLPVEALLGKRPSEHCKAPITLEYEACIREVIATGTGCELEYCWPSRDGRRVTSHVRLTPEFDADGLVAGVLTIGRDISAQKESERQLERSESLAHVGHWQWDFRRRESMVSAEVCRIFGQARDWRPHFDEVLAMIVEEDRERIMALFRDAIAHQRAEISYSYRITNLRGEEVHLYTEVQLEYGADGQPLRLIGTNQDVTELKNYERYLHDLAYIDTLTGLPNRALLNERLGRAIANSEKHKRSVGLMLLDLDRFKEINETFGHGSGDRVLYEAGKRLGEVLGTRDTLARMGGDEFAIVLPKVREAAHLGATARRIMNAFAAPFRIGDKEVFITASLGIAVFPNDASEIESLLQYADTALHHAKARGRAAYHFYSAELTAKSRERMALEAALRNALRRNELDLHYQAQVDLASGRVIGVEALMRWQHPELGAVPPAKFIGIAEDTGLIVDMGEWALRTACRQAVLWNHGRERPLTMAVNLSTRQFRTGNLAERIAAIARETGCRPQWLELEITESLLLDDSSETRQALEQLSALGFSIAIDDFGTGYSALGYLNRFPIHTLKIDRSFVARIADNRASAELVKAIISMAQALRLSVVAEGIEEAGQEAFLQANGCQVGQGYRYGRPAPAGEFRQP